MPQVPVELLWNPFNAGMCYNASVITEEDEITLQGHVNLLRCKEGEQLTGGAGEPQVCKWLYFKKCQ